ncbi:MAG: IS66 family transposase [Bryobacteraceae bacterium]
MPKLSDEQIQKRLIEGRNYKRLYHELKDKFDVVAAEHKQCPKLIAELTAKYDTIIETQNARITELETMVYGRKPKGRSTAPKPDASKQPRSAISYRRPIPPAAAITTKEHYAIDQCNHCAHPLTRKEVVVHYEEDIVLAALSPDTRFKTVTKQTVERGWCSRCGHYSSAKDLRGQTVTLGPNIRSLVCYLITLRDHSYDQVIHLLWDLYGFRLTDGEIAAILDSRRLQLLPEYERLKDTIRAGPAVHMDESRWKIQSEGSGYAWSMSSMATSDVVFKLADGRGKGNAETLLGKQCGGVGITDRYSAYKHLFALHQICWAHLQRNAKDLTHLECLGEVKLRHVTQFYSQLAAIYADIRAYQAELFDETRRQTQASELLAQTKELCRPHELDPKKLTDLKAGILEYRDCLFVCLTVDGVPADNNRAERDIRKLVMKRAKSLGCKTTKGARTLEVLLSVCWSLYNRDRDSFFANFQSLGV